MHQTTQYIPNIMGNICFLLFCCVLILVNLTHILQVYFIVLGQSYDCPNVNETTLKNMGKWITGLILGLHPANGRWRYFVTMSLILGTNLESALNHIHLARSENTFICLTSEKQNIKLPILWDVLYCLYGELIEAYWWHTMYWNLVNTTSGNGLVLNRNQAIIWNNADLLSIRWLRKICEIWMKIKIF